MAKYTPRRCEALPRGVFAHLWSIFNHFRIVFRRNFDKFRTATVKRRTNFVPIIANRITTKAPIIFHIRYLWNTLEIELGWRSGDLRSGDFIGIPKIYTNTSFRPRKNKEMAGVDNLVVYMQSAVKHSTFYIHPGVVYIQTGVFYSSLHIHHQMVHTSHFTIFSRPEPGGGVYLRGPNFTCGHRATAQPR